MTQDTRKDRRAKIVSLNVRYKSATVDEFIDNHSHDVSKGGIFIKTPTPFPPGTLLKFEIRIAGDKAVIAGVGRVVWKREAVQAGGESPAGMGVKFIKLDDASRVVIDKLVDTKGDEAGAAFEAGNTEAAGTAGASSGAPPPPSGDPGRPPPIAPSSVERSPEGSPFAPSAVERTQPASPFAPAPSGHMAAQSREPPGGRKATIVGLGSASQTAAPPVRPAAGTGFTVPRLATASDAGPPVPAASSVTSPGPFGAPQKASITSGASGATPGGSAMFPKTNSEAEMPPVGEQTVMKQAAELLEEALKGAGGSMDEIGTNPLFDRAGKPTLGADPKPQVAAVKEPPPAAKAVADAKPGLLEEDPGPASKRGITAPRRGGRDTPSVRPTPSPERRASSPSATAVPAGVPAKSGGRGLTYVLALAAVGLVGYVAYTQFVAPTNVDSTSTRPTATAPPPSVVIPPPPPPSASVALPDSASAAASSSAAPSNSASASASPNASASASPAPDAGAGHAMTAPLPPPPPKPVAAPPLSPPPPPHPVASDTAATDTRPPAVKPPAPKPPAPKPKPADDDNPY